MCQLLTTQIELVPKEVLHTFQTIPVDTDDSPHALVELRRAVTTRLQTTEAQAGSRKRKREDSSINLMDDHGDVIMKEASQAVSPEVTKKRASYENICANVFGGRQNWLVGGLGHDDEADEGYQGRVMDGLLAELDSVRYVIYIKHAPSFLSLTHVKQATYVRCLVDRPLHSIPSFVHRPNMPRVPDWHRQDCFNLCRSMRTV